jgi:hypothetical protein
MFQTLELKQEQAVQQQRQENNMVNGGARPAPDSNARKLKCLNLKTYKYHVLGDYVSAIRLYGTTDLYSTQSVSCYLTLCLAPLIVIQSELEHRKSKACFVQTNGQLTLLQLSKIERRQSRIHMIRKKISRLSQHKDPENVVNNPQAQYNIGKSENSPVHLPTFLQKNCGDPAIKASSLVLFTHLRILISITLELFPQAEGTFTSLHPRLDSARSCTPPWTIQPWDRLQHWTSSYSRLYVQSHIFKEGLDLSLQAQLIPLHHIRHAVRHRHH